MQPGQVVSVDQLKSTTPGFVTQLKGLLMTQRYNYATIFVDQFSKLSFVFLQKWLTSAETILAKQSFEHFARVLSNDSKVRRMSTRKQKFVGTRKQNSEAASITKHAKDSDASDSNSHKEEKQRTSSSMNDDNDVQLSQPCERSKYQDTRRYKVEPRSYRDVVMSGQGWRTLIEKKEENRKWKKKF